jgi:hypothetical protein
MSERMYLFAVGACILIALYLEINSMIYFLCLWLLFEAITNIRLTTLTQNLMGRPVAAGLTVFQSHQRFDFDSFRVWRITVAIMLGGSFILIHEQNIEVVWFIPWFMGFAILGAGVSGVCPVLLLIRWLGFK